MASQLKKERLRNLGIYGTIRQSEVDDILIPDGAVVESINFHFDRKGASTVRPGITTIGASVVAGYNCVGLFNAQQGTALAVFTQTGSSSIYSYSGSSWGVSLGGGTATVKARFVDFASFTVAINFDDAVATHAGQSMRFWAAGANGASYWRSTGNPINPQNMWGYRLQFGEVYKSRVYLAGDPSYPSRLFFSSVITSAGNITWAPTSDFVDINPGDGEDATGLKRYSLELLFFKPNYIYRFRTSGVDPDPLIKVGTRSQESIIEGKRGVYFHHDTGFYRYSGGYPEEISGPISDVVEAIPFTQYDDIVSWNDEDHIYWSVGNLTLSETTGDVTWKNVVLCYTESADVWTVFSYPTNIQKGSVFNNGSSLRRMVGTENGVVAEFHEGTSDLGEPIKYSLITKWIEQEIINRKTLQTLVAICEKAQGIELMYQTDENYEWKTIGTMRKMVNVFDNLSINWHRIRFKVAGISKLEAPVFRGLELVKGLVEEMVYHA